MKRKNKLGDILIFQEECCKLRELEAFLVEVTVLCEGFSETLPAQFDTSGRFCDLSGNSKETKTKNHLRDSSCQSLLLIFCLFLLHLSSSFLSSGLPQIFDLLSTVTLSQAQARL